MAKVIRALVIQDTSTTVKPASETGASLIHVVGKAYALLQSWKAGTSTSVFVALEATSTDGHVYQSRRPTGLLRGRQPPQPRAPSGLMNLSRSLWVKYLRIIQRFLWEMSLKFLFHTQDFRNLL